MPAFASSASSAPSARSAPSTTSRNEASALLRRLRDRELLALHAAGPNSYYELGPKAQLPVDAQELEPGTQGLPAKDTQGLRPDTQGLRPDTQGFDPDAQGLKRGLTARAKPG